ncbi:MAG: 30S ribosomal protein S4 [candidate division WS2 bacterium ADurb.Bin280]|uniref:Small ribosomal subunit protein uS4 n=1 Tax=candidate division WS2 bacterium ADurb.Bin280 TaxID=1852829 RepID=A0A1V5SCI1_9BACT|nr:MAG: 30S ribosomal protein S4 [candidate division WS2 bacterium ADurb.Bin280]
MNKDARCRMCRRSGEKLFLKGDKCSSPACPFNRRSYAPGQAGAKARKRKGSDYSIQLMEKQKARAIYGLREKQMRKFFAEARKVKGATGERLVQMLESRIDNIVFKAGWAFSRDMARQMVSHGHIAINGKKVTIPSYVVKIGDTISQIGNNKQTTDEKNLPVWIKRGKDASEVIYERLPMGEEIISAFDVQLITEFYSK